MNRIRLVRVSVPLIATLAAMTVFAATATAETWTGETTTVAGQEGNPTPELTLVKASAAYDPAAGAVSFAIVTSAPPQLEIEGKPNEDFISAFFVRSTAPCTVAVYQELSNPPEKVTIYAEALFESKYSESTGARGANLSPTALLPTAKTVSGATSTFTSQANALKEQGFNCAAFRVEDETQKDATVMVLPLAPPPPLPPAPPAPVPPAPLPPALSIANPKPITLKVGKWKTVKIKVTNTGGTDAVQGSLRIKAPKGALVKPEKQQLPTLAPGASWTVSVRLELTKKAKQRSTLTLTGTAAGAAAATSSMVLKLKPETHAKQVRPASKRLAEESVEPQVGAWKGKTKQGFPVYFRVASDGVTNVRVTYHDAICGKASIHEGSASLAIDEAGHFSGVIYPANGGVEFEGTVTGPRTIKGKIVAGESSGLPGCLGGSFSFTAHPKS